jgi:hypothetical protein
LTSGSCRTVTLPLRFGYKDIQGAICVKRIAQDQAAEPTKAVAYMRTSSATNVGADKDSERRQRSANRRDSEWRRQCLERRGWVIAVEIGSTGNGKRETLQC